MPILIGTSGWQYRHWKGGFYPPSLPLSRWLDHYAQRFATVEVNNAFYRLPEAETFASWGRTVPADFVVSVKVSRYLTHIRRLRQPAEPVARLMERARELGAKLGPLLLQLPPNLSFDPSALDETLQAFPAGSRVAVEFRHPSWFVGETRTLLEHHGAACCLTDTDGPRTPEWATAGWGYVRFHHGRAAVPSCYGTSALHSWAERVARLWPASAEVFAYFNNDGHGCAPHDAHQFALAARRAGLVPTRVPALRETPLS